MDNVIKLNANAVTPEDVMKSLSERLPDMKEIYVVVKTHDRKYAAWSSGDVSGMSNAALYLQHLATCDVLRQQEDIESDND